ncbi:MAG TPA: uroporphyrinogen-III C-methyltransferase [Rhodoblastus sp.]|nr:uroporphyrinogen-III C-methyltransferase [Rhodoblastus sp.]
MTGIVHLIGAGPGAPDLLTLRALRALEAADVVVYDRLVSSEILDFAPSRAPRIDVGKASGDHPVPQRRINELLARLAHRYARVARIKGGDPFVFGRGGEEAAHLARAGIEFDIIPGVTAAQGAAAALALPLTLRGVATSLRYVTGHRQDNGALDLDWMGLCDPATTLAIYMGLSNMPEIARAMIAHGRDPATPAVAVSCATTPRQRCAFGVLGDIAEIARGERLPSPVLFLIGEAVEQIPARGDVVIASEHRDDALA